jgi:hypothetical protein
MFRKTVLAAAMLGLFLSVGSVVPSQARDRDDKCEQRVRKAEENLHKAERRHGEHSRQAEQQRRKLEQAREKCRGDEHRDRDHDRH